MDRSLALAWVPSLIAVLLALAITGCSPAGSTTAVDTARRDNDTTPTAGGDGVATIYLAGGCFWGVEKLMASIPGVIDAQSGYANGTTDSPSYQDVCTGRTGYAETVKVDYDPNVAPLPFLLDFYYQAIDPTSLNRQGNDVGTQYRTGIYFVDPADRPAIERSLARLQGRYDRPIAIELEPLSCFTPAEEYHQDYLDKNPGGYCHIEPGLFQKAAGAVPDSSDFAESSAVE